MMRHSLGLLSASLLLAAALPALAEPYRDLPGVKDPEDLKKAARDEIVCTSRLERQRPMSPSFERNGLAYRTYSCSYGRVKVRSSREPNMIEYRKFKEHYRAD